MARPWTTALLLPAAFILLSGVSSEPRRCYWCGPLAEQVHRSRRSAPCSASDHVTVCEPGYNYCAVVATSPQPRCCWCGPLAEQVHRSRRSAPCGASDHVSVCEPGYNYCAVVATSPRQYSRVESRYCVKMYQDECYPLYCNSTKTWKMTCPCRGELCNGPNTERENEAFALLPKLVAKTHNARIKKRTANPTPHLIKHDSKNKIIASDAELHNPSNLSTGQINKLSNENKLIVSENDSNLDEKSGNMQSDQPINQPVVVEHHNEENYQSTVANRQPDNIQTSSTVNNQLIEIVIHVSGPTEKSIKENEQSCTDSPTTAESNEANKNAEPIKEEGEPAATTVPSVLNTETSVTPTENTNAIESETMKPTEIVQQSATETKTTGKPHAESPTNITEIMQNDQSINPIDEMQNDAPLISPTDTVQPLKTTEVNKMDEALTKNTVKTSDGIPTAEALLQNGSPVSVAPVAVTEKSSEPSTTEATTILIALTTQEQITKMATTPAPRRKNNAVRITFSYTLLLICVVYL